MFKWMIGAFALLMIFMLMEVAAFALGVYTHVTLDPKNEPIAKYEVNRRVDRALSIFHSSVPRPE